MLVAACVGFSYRCCSRRRSIIKRTNPRHLYLFNDLLLVAKDDSRGKLSFKAALPLADIVLRDARGLSVSEDGHEPPPFSWEIAGPDKTLLFYAEDAAQKEEWFRAIGDAITAHNEATDPESCTALGWRHRRVQGTLWSAAVMNDSAVAERLLLTLDEDEEVGSARANRIDADGMVALHYAAALGHEEIINLLLANGADKEAMDRDLRTPLHHAIAARKVSSTTVLCDNEADVRAADVQHRTALHMLAERSGNTVPTDIALMQLLTTWGANCTELDMRGFSPLHSAARAGSAPAVRALLEGGAKVNHRVGEESDEFRGATALHIACSTGGAVGADVISALLQHGANPNAPDPGGSTPLQLVLSVLQADAAERASASVSGDTAVPPPPPPGAEAGEPPLHVRATEACKVLVSLGARTDVAGQGGKPPAAYIAELGLTSLASQLEPAAAAFRERTYPRGSVLGGLPHHRVGSTMQPDSASPHCVFCVTKWSFSNRRHHCRSCGALCCGACSSKKWPLRDVSKKGSAADREPARVCDGCFNRMADELAASNARVAAARAPKPPSATGGAGGGGGSPGAGAADSDEARRAALLGGASSAATEPRSREAQVSGDVAGVQKTMSEAGDELNKRGEKLASLAEKTARMNQEAEDFAEGARRLREQAEAREKRSRWGGLF